MVNARVTNGGPYQYFVGNRTIGKPRFTRGCQGGICRRHLWPNFLRCYGYFLGLRHRLTGKCVIRFCKLQGGLVALGFLHPIECGGSCGDVVEVVEEIPRGAGKSYCRAKALFLRPKGK